MGQLIRDQVPDKNGTVLPASLTMGSYEIRELTRHVGAPSLFEGKVVYDKKYGSVTYGCGSCCAYKGAAKFYFDPLGIPLDGGADQGAEILDTCSGTYVDITSDLDNSWSTGNTSIATVDAYGGHTGVAMGSTTTRASAEEQVWYKLNDCPILPVNPSGGDNVTPTLTVYPANQNKSIFVGSDPIVTGEYGPNHFAAVGSPSGGTLTVTSSNSSDTFTYYTENNNPAATVKTSVQSTSSLDRTLTFTYTDPNGDQATQTLNVTAREFAYLEPQTLPGNICSLGYGYEYSITYSTYTHPDKTALNSNDAVDGVAVPESFNPSPNGSCGNVGTGPGTLDANGYFVDNLEFCSNTKLPTCSVTTTQTIGVGGYTVRKNTITFANTGITYTSLGPTQ